MRLPAFENLDTDLLITPCLLVCAQTVQRNLEAMIAIAGSADRLRPHVKTHKCPDIVKLAGSLGIYKHKCATLAEAELLSGSNIDRADVLIAYPQVGPAIGKLVEMVQRFPNVRLSTVVDSALPAQELSRLLTQQDLSLDVLIEVDPGMHRTGVALGQSVLQLAELVQQLPGLRLAGLHIYDGHHHQVDLEQRTVAVEEMMREVLQLVERMQRANLRVEKLVCGGTPTFPALAQWPARRPDGQESPDIELSPGTSVLSDYNYGRDYPDITGIEPAAILLTRVISKPGSDLVTLDLGYKAVSADSPAGKRCHFLDLMDAQELRHNEEHLVVRTSAAGDLKIGQVLRVLPAHICPTVALHDHMLVVSGGRVVQEWPIIRHRLYR